MLITSVRENRDTGANWPARLFFLAISGPMRDLVSKTRRKERKIKSKKLGVSGSCL